MDVDELVDQSRLSSQTTSVSSGDLYEPVPSAAKRIRSSINIINEDVVAAFDRCNITDRQAVHVITSVCESLKEREYLSISVEDLALNRSTIRRKRIELRAKRYEEIRQHFGASESTSYVLHWDGKILPDLQNVANVDRLPVVVTFEGKEQLLGVPEIESGTGLNQANCLYEIASDWGLCGGIQALCCDTASTNLGPFNGAAVNLERLLDRDLLYLPCRHHILELVLRAAYETMFPGTKGPKVAIFQRFQSAWPHVNTSNYKSGLEEDGINEILNEKVDEIKRFVINLLDQDFPRDDYRELLNLVLVFLGSTPTDYKFLKPGAIHHARWMAKAIYALKIYLFRSEFALSNVEKKGFRDVCLFIVFVYVKAWFLAPIALKAPNQDLGFLKDINSFHSINKDIAKNASDKFKNHLWYLSPELAVLTLFDPDVSNSVKLRIVKNLEIASDQKLFTCAAGDDDCDIADEPTHTKRYKTNKVDDILNKEIDFFVNAESMNFFKRFKLVTNFLKIQPSEWINDESFLAAQAFVKNLKVINDCAERMVKLMTDFRCKFTKDEKQLQYVLQIVNDHRQKKS